MSRIEFSAAVRSHPGLKILEETDDGFLIAGTSQTRQPARFAISRDEVELHPWSEICAVLTGARAARILDHVSRIVGYYSRMVGWNRSKLAELADRHKGNYALPE